MSDKEKEGDDKVVEFRRKPNESKPKSGAERSAPPPVTRRHKPHIIQGYKPGQKCLCLVTAIEPGGYAVTIIQDNLPGYLPSNTMRRVGDQVIAKFVCIDKMRLLMREPFSS